MPATGTVSTGCAYPGRSPEFAARNAYIYLPPAYQSTPRAELPVIVMMAGQPGEPKDWFDGGQARRRDGRLRRSARRAGAGGGGRRQRWATASPTRLASIHRSGNVFSYLEPGRAGLDQGQPAGRPGHHRSGRSAGLSNGGTCALVLAVNAPDVYRTFAGDVAGGRRSTSVIDAAATIAAVRWFAGRIRRGGSADRDEDQEVPGYRWLRRRGTGRHVPAAGRSGSNRRRRTRE